MAFGGVDRGAGEVILTSIDKDGTKKGFDLELFEKINEKCDVPLVFSGGMSCPQDILGLKNLTQCDGIALASILHYENYSIEDIKNFAKINNFHIKE